MGHWLFLSFSEFLANKTHQELQNEGNTGKETDDLQMFSALKKTHVCVLFFCRCLKKNISDCGGPPGLCHNSSGSRLRCHSTCPKWGPWNSFGQHPHWSLQICSSGQKYRVHHQSSLWPPCWVDGGKESWEKTFSAKSSSHCGEFWSS